MAKAADWPRARALFEAGKSLREISKDTHIDHSSIGKRAKKEGWGVDKLPRLIADGVKVHEEISTLNIPQRGVVEAEIARIVEAKKFYATNARKVVKYGVAALSAEPTAQSMKTVLDGMKTGMIVEGLVPFYPDKTTVAISNTNAQQNNSNLSTMTDAELERIIAGA